MIDPIHKPQTPTGQQSQLFLPDTKPVVHQTSQHGYLTGKLRSGHSPIFHDIGSLLIVPFDHLVKRLFPLSQTDVDAVLVKLKKQKIIDEEGWKSFKQSPSETSKNEKMTFAPLSGIINGIANLQPGAAVHYFDSPDNTPNDSTRPDAYLKVLGTKTVDKQDDKKVHWFDIAVPFEFKKNEKNPIDNNSKVIWSLHNIMREDPCRRFACGITIEDQDLRVWLSNRAYLVVTQPINFLEDFPRVVSLFYSLVTASHVELGWDPTITRVSIDNRIQYEITVNDDEYTTIEELATYGADSMIGRGTRVWKAKDKRGKLVVIKDAWRDSDRLSEGKILEKILIAIRAKFPDEIEEAKKYFITIGAYGDVVVSGSPDYTLGLADGSKHAALPVGCKWVKIDVAEGIISVPPSHPVKTHKLSVGHIPSPDEPTKSSTPTKLEDAPIPCRLHHRTVSDDIGTVIYDMNNYKDIIRCLIDTCKALFYMHLVGWVHRDYSVNNALWVNGTGKLMDFEYAKCVDEPSSHDIRTGTLNFMACEVEAMRHLFRSNPEWGGQAAIFRMNFLHDLESVFWSFTWVLLYHTDGDFYTRNMNPQWNLFKELFPATSMTRYMFLKQGHPMVPHVVMTTLRASVGDLSKIAHALVYGYTEVEKLYPQITAGEEIIKITHKEIMLVLSNVLETTDDIRLVRVLKLLNREFLEDEEEQLSPTKKKIKFSCS